MSTTYIILLPFLLTCAIASAAECENATSLSLMIDSLLATYDRDSPPDSKIVVNLTLHLRHANIRESESTVRIQADLQMNWIDKRLSWNAGEWGCSTWLVSSERLWRPDVVLLNAAATTAGDYALRARVSNNGSVSWIKRLDISTPISMQLDNWPNDMQTCTFKFGSRMHNSDEMDFVIDKRIYSMFESGAWDVTALSSAVQSQDRGEVEARVAMFQMSFRRRAPAHALAAGAVFAVVLLLLLSAAALPPATRPPLAAVSAFISILWQMSVSSRLGEAGSAPRVSRVQAAAAVCAAACCAAAALVCRVQRCRRAPPPPLRSLISNLSNTCDLTPLPEWSCEQSAWWGACGRVLDRALLLLLLLALLLLVLVYCF
ncbi:neuronal acetylcholine receptor subunit beta-4-like [Bombyx mandarina]|uniref:Neuronal acetylcholine receptor subunit beta-4-like n=1 Tax=Bombyx mandarina TaxID=7092 RepID=A0A6J2K5B6_BOMMA|nr:neuronal acetylcholine receptor subunit beta-4-like [Bombyx mandarina]